MSFWKNKPVLVTGGTGFIGSHLVERLCERGAKVRTVGRNRARFESFLPHLAGQVEFVEGDLTSAELNQRLVRGIEAVFNLTAHVGGVGYNSKHAGTLFTQNLMSASSIIDAAARGGVERFLCVSSACVYHRNCPVPTPETEGFVNDPEQTNFGYGWAKRALEIQARCYAEEYPMKVGIARPYNAYGPRDDFAWETSHVIPALIRKVVEGQNPLEVWGDGSQTRSFLYATDFVEGLILNLEKYPEPDPVNIGTDDEISIADTIRLIIELAGSQSEIKFDLSKPRGQPRRNGDFSKARAKFGYEARVSLREGLRQTIEWYRGHRL